MTISTEVNGARMRRAKWLLGLIARVERRVAVAAFVVLVAVVFLDVASREVTGTGLHWALQTGVYANFFVAMLGIGVASAAGVHLRPQFADKWLPCAWNPLVERLGEAVTGLFFLGFAILAVGVVEETRALGERAPVLGNLVWPLQGLIPIVFSLATVRHGLYAVWPALRPRRAPAAPGRAD